MSHIETGDQAVDAHRATHPLATGISLVPGINPENGQILLTPVVAVAERRPAVTDYVLRLNVLLDDVIPPELSFDLDMDGYLPLQFRVPYTQRRWIMAVARTGLFGLAADRNYPICAIQLHPANFATLAFYLEHAAMWEQGWRPGPDKKEKR